MINFCFVFLASWYMQVGIWLSRKVYKDAKTHRILNSKTRCPPLNFQSYWVLKDCQKKIQIVTALGLLDITHSGWQTCRNFLWIYYVCSTKHFEISFWPSITTLSIILCSLLPYGNIGKIWYKCDNVHKNILIYKVYFFQRSQTYLIKQL